MQFGRISVFIMLLFSFAAEADNNQEQSSHCEENQSSMNDCAEIEFQKADAELNKLYKEQMAYLKNSQFKAYLKQAQIAWIGFRDKDCMYQLGPEEDRGSISPLIKYSCMYNHTKKRIEDLKFYVGCRENGCPF